MNKGECFRCNEKFSQDHMFKNKEFRVMVLEEEKEEVGVEDCDGP